MFRIGLNPYGLAYTVGLQGAGTSRANPKPMGLQGFIDLARELGAECLELHGAWLERSSDDELRKLGGQLAELAMTPIVSAGLEQREGETLERSIQCAALIGARLVRLHLSPVLEGARASWGPAWPAMVAHARSTLRVEAARARDAGVALGIEDHQDFGSEELVAIAEEAGLNVGVVLDTGNPYAVGEDPVAFVTRAAHRIVHVHLKDYRAQFTREGYRLVRCAIGDGAVPFDKMAAALARAAELKGPPYVLTASIEPGALEARHVRLLRSDWWQGYPPRAASELARAIGRLRATKIADGERGQTPWETGAPAAEIVDYEIDQVRRSVRNVRESLWLTESTR